ncbi:hypothetical protein G9C98_008331 [Cotesia typhae]|uniref:Uncharacterized protein n=1 Tax=Cotesia typhae TaxID=2053667 RepID=A0A8J5QUA9_9HYME|nr:hypothetical protein G9C98_008331 [Cotesia typhae]
MNYWMSWKLNVLISMSILIKGCLCCQVVTDRPIEEIHEENKKSPWLVIINDMTVERDFMGGLASHGYGSLIHAKLVLTSGYSFFNVKPENLEVFANVSAVSKKDFRYDRRQVIFMTGAWAIKEKEKSVNDSVILILYKPFDLGDRVNVINLAGSDDKVDKNCKIYHWQIVTSSYTDRLYDSISTDILHYPYNITLNAEEFKLTEEEIVKMRKDLDCIVEKCIDENGSSKEMTRKLSFLGTPIVCPLEDGTPVQVGFSTIVYEIQGKGDNQVVKYDSGGFVRFLSDKEKTNCTAKNKEIICVTRKVSVVLNSSLPKKKEHSIEDWAVLLLEEPFPMNDRINVIKLAYRVLHYAYNVTLNGDEFELTEEGITKMEKDGDCLIENCVDYDEKLQILAKKISFAGSPIICQRLDETPIQVGFSTAVFVISDDEKMPNFKFQRGGFVRLFNDTDRYLKGVVHSKYL